MKPPQPRPPSLAECFELQTNITCSPIFLLLLRPTFAPLLASRPTLFETPFFSSRNTHVMALHNGTCPCWFSRTTTKKNHKQNDKQSTETEQASKGKKKEPHLATSATHHRCSASLPSQGIQQPTHFFTLLYHHHANAREKERDKDRNKDEKEGKKKRKKTFRRY